MSRSINDINKLTNSLITLCAVVDGWCDLGDHATPPDSRLRHALHEFLLEGRFVLVSLITGTHVDVPDKISYAAKLHELQMSQLRDELRDMLFEYLCHIEQISNNTLSTSEQSLAAIEQLIASNEKKLRLLEVQL